MSRLNSPWHEGERALHQRLGIAERMEEVGPRAIRRFMSEQIRTFFAQLPFILLGSTDTQNRIWASLLTGPRGFVTSPDAHRLNIAAMPASGDPLAEALIPGQMLGLLGIELPTRRRNRVNGRIAAIGDSHFSIAVEESFGNCPKYIVRRDYLSLVPAQPVTAEPISSLAPEARNLIGRAETFFVASSAGPGRPADVSHRGGQPGFITMSADGTLTVPDYDGNFYFNTLGNFLLNPQAGLLFPDFASGDMLQLTGAIELLLDGPEISTIPGAKSLWRFHPSEGQWLRNALPLRFTGVEISPFSPPVKNRAALH